MPQRDGPFTGVEFVELRNLGSPSEIRYLPLPKKYRSFESMGYGLVP